MWADNEVWRFSAAVVLALLGAMLVRDHGRDRSARASVALIACVIGHLVFPLLLRVQAPVLLSHVALLLGCGTSFALWLLAEVHFDDEFRWRPAHAFLLVALVGLGYLSWWVSVGVVPFAARHERLWITLPKIVSVVLVVHALIRVYVGARSDLILARLRARYAVLVMAATYILVQLLGEALLTGSSGEALAERLHSFAVLVLVSVVAFRSLRIAPEVLRPARPSVDAPVVDSLLAERLNRLLQVDEAFREEGLTIGSLAEKLSVQEYKLRQLINTQLGFKNFNAFLHSFRVKAAQDLLADPAKAHLGVAEIAYQVGYRSLGTFNKGFKEMTGQTPTEYRASQRRGRLTATPSG
jgi:AraC-like DNA-binding protein